MLWLERFHPDLVDAALDAWEPGEEALEYLSGDRPVSARLRGRLADA